MARTGSFSSNYLVVITVKQTQGSEMNSRNDVENSFKVGRFLDKQNQMFADH